MPMRGAAVASLDRLRCAPRPIPLGKLTIIEGDPGVGKSFLTLAIASAGSRGQPLPGHANGGGLFTSLILTAEDGLADTLRPRVDRMGADPHGIVVLDELVMLDEPGLARIDEAITETRAKLVVIDPLVAFIGSGVDIHRANETRAHLAPLANLAETHNVAICVVRHLAKGRTKAIYAGLGSIDFIAAVRSALLVGFDPSNDQTRVMAHTPKRISPQEGCPWHSPWTPPAPSCGQANPNLRRRISYHFRLFRLREMTRRSSSSTCWLVTQ